MIPWQATILIHSLLSGLRSVQNKRIGLLKTDVSAYTLVASYFCVALLGGCIAYVSNEPILHEAAWDARYFIVLGGLLFAVANVLVLKLFRLVPASVGVMLGLLSTLSVMIIATMFAGESLTDRQWMGTGILLTAVFTVQHFSKKNESKKVKKSIFVGGIIACVASLLIGFAIVNEKYLLDRIDLETYLLYGWSTQFAASLAVFFSLKSKVGVIKDWSVHLNVWVYSVLLAVSGIFFVLTLNSSGSSSLTVASASVKTIFAMVLAYFILRENEHLLAKSIGLAMSICGLFLLFS